MKRNIIITLIALGLISMFSACAGKRPFRGGDGPCGKISYHQAPIGQAQAIASIVAVEGLKETE